MGGFEEEGKEEMNKWKERVLYMKAIRALPQKFVHKNTLVSVWDKKSVIVANPKYQPMIYLQSLGKWKKLKPQEVEADGHQRVNEIPIRN